MASQEQVNLLKECMGTHEGMLKWNKWRKEHLNIYLNLSGVNLNSKSLDGMDLSRANLHGASLRWASLSVTKFQEADLSDVDFFRAELTFADLRNANLSRADLSGTNLAKARLTGANFNDARISVTIFGDVDISQVKGLDTVKHASPSTIGIDTIIRSKGSISESFLRGAGVPDNVIEYVHSLANTPIKYYTCFISYSSKDQKFAERLYADLQSKGVRCWFAPEDMKIGDKIRSRIDESIRLYDKLLLVLSERSVMSEWIEYEVEAALEKEQQGKSHVLFPIRLDKAVMESTTAWANHIRRTRHIGNFEYFEDHKEYKKVFDRLLFDLKTGE
jgi:TIR domain/Pentapeptide repeats (8 copies)